ncbi:hypothetical protein Aspvir_007887 [Aspergillus viridinutans]|uniref:FAD-binding domain-containing protein n=1 Tax=Aspergillus viridinutans TaxID=75553 RepID=A0A9P3C062_ASPVI|nr:uncharacterized protein Aspvir_007887 [Aspergillus viridinutans]GIK03813.1 hypothetical protein Aspvir_007887 [Aspergillus viridinutans]
MPSVNHRRWPGRSDGRLLGLAFPVADIRQSCAIQCPDNGSIMTAPRENRLVRRYIQVKGDKQLEQTAQDHSEDTPRALIKAAERIFLAGDAAHTHSPKAGQGMNVSMQDTYNLVWKLGSVITGAADPIILDTYESERRPVAEEHMKIDSVLVHAYEQEAKDAEGVDQVRDEYAGFMAGVKITYAPNMLVASNEKSGDRALAKNIAVGMRIQSFPVVNQADGSTIPLLNVLPSNGWWRLIVFSGDLRRPGVWERLTSFAETFSNAPTWHIVTRLRTQEGAALHSKLSWYMRVRERASTSWISRISFIHLMTSGVGLLEDIC